MTTYRSVCFVRAALVKRILVLPQILPHSTKIIGPKKRDPLAEILDAAAGCFMDNGYAGSSLDDVAAVMGKTKGRIYHYFASKSDLLNAVRARAMDINFAAVQPAYDASTPPKEKFLSMARDHVLTMMEQHPYQRVLLESLILHKGVDAQPEQREAIAGFITARRRYDDMFRDVLQKGADNGDFQIATMSYALHSILVTLNSTVLWFTPRPEDLPQDRQQIANELADMALRALCPPTHKLSLAKI